MVGTSIVMGLWPKAEVKTRASEQAFILTYYSSVSKEGDIQNYQVMLRRDSGQAKVKVESVPGRNEQSSSPLCGTAATQEGMMR